MASHETTRWNGIDRPGGTSSPPMVVGIGTSADGLDALGTLLATVPPDSGIVWVVVAHRSPEGESRLADLLQPHVSLLVTEVTGTVRCEPDRVYVLPPSANLEAVDSHLRLNERGERPVDRSPVEHFFRTLAGTYEGDAVAVILTGTGNDGSLGLAAVKERGGLVVAQDPDEADHDGMPRSALATGLVDRTLPLSRVVPEILAYFRTRPRVAVPDEAGDDAAENGPARLLEKVLAEVRARTGRDFRRYRRSTLLRRITRRMRLQRLEEVGDYLEVLREDEGEVGALVDDMLITVTRFFRDPELFGTLEHEVVPRLFDGKDPDDEVRVWSVGCATGEEAYSLAMLLLEEAERRDRPPRIQIFASDLNEKALAAAREGRYAGDIAEHVSRERLQRFFHEEPEGYLVRKQVRKTVLFARQDLLADPPYSQLDLVACRNLLIYLQPDLQREVVELFHYALRPGGFLAVTRPEYRDWGGLFLRLDGEPAVLRRGDVPTPETRLAAPIGTRRAQPDGERASAPSPPVRHGELHHRMVERHAPPSVLLSPNDRVLHLSEHAGRYLRLPGGAPPSGIERLVRPELLVELRSALREAREHGEPRSTRPVPVGFDDGLRSVVLHVRPALDPVGAESGTVLVLFEERAVDELPQGTTRAGRSRGGAGMEAGGGVVEPGPVGSLESELERTRERLLSLTRKHRAREEDLRAANEELHSAHQELRSTMEELETSREELQSMNEELRALAEQNQHKAEELEVLSMDLERLLVATEIGTVFLDTDLRILRYTPRITYLFNTRPSDRGRPLSDLKHRLDYDELLDDARGVLREGEPVEREVGDDEGRSYLARLLPHWGAGGDIDGVVLVLVDITTRKRMEAAERESRIKSQFLSTMSHELRTPLNAVIGLAELLETGVMGPMNEKQEEHLGRIKRSAWHLVGIIEEVLTFSRSESGKEEVSREDVDLATAVRDIIDMIGPTARAEGVDLSLEGADEPVRIRTDGGKTAQIVTNLVGNAVKFARSEVAVELEGDAIPIELRVRDDGRGIPVDRLDEIFEPFTQLDSSNTREKGGTGLGLTIARRQARLLGGDIRVESVEGEGSTFTLWLPRELPRPEEEAE